jgi:hypothetical protein
MTEGLSLQISVRYREPGYSAEQIAELEASLSEIGQTEVESFQAPAAVERTLIEFAVNYLGGKALDLIGKKLIWPSLSDFAKAIGKLRATKAAAHEPEPAIFKVVHTFEDLEVVVFQPSQGDLRKMGETLFLIYERLTSGRLRGLPVNLIEMPLIQEGDSWLLPEWADYLVGGTATRWAISTSDGNLQRSPYNAAEDEWLNGDSPV